MEFLSILVGFVVGTIIVGFLVGRKLQKVVSERNRLDKELTLCKFECEKANDDTAVAEKEIESYDKKLSFLQDENAKLEDENRRFAIENSQLSTSYNSIEKQHIDLKELYSALIKKSDADMVLREKRVSELMEDNKNLNVTNSELKTNLDNITQQMQELKESAKQNEQRLKDVFENIASKILDEKSQKLDRFGSEQLKNILTPFGENIKNFKEKVSQLYIDEAKERHSLKEQIGLLVEANNRISEDAVNLTKALKGSNKTQGDWGEMILEKILENSGLPYGKEGFELQNTLKDKNGNSLVSESGHRMIPDAIVHFPDDRNVIIDSKVSLVSYLNYCNSDSEKEQKEELKKHIASIKSHISELDVKSYENYVDGATDFVMMFIPNESAYVLAIQSEPSLWNDAYKKKIMLISPTNLITSLKIVSDLWTREKQNKNIEDIVSRGSALYEKCVSFLDSMNKIERNLSAASKSYNDAMTQLSGKGGVVRQAEMLQELGIKSKKILPVVSSEKQLAIDDSEIVNSNS